MTQLYQPDELNDEEILVMFPASKNYQKEAIDDPLEDLLNEFSDLTDDQLDEHIELKNESINDLKSKNISELLLLEEVIDRMSYLLREIEFYSLNK